MINSIRFLEPVVILATTWQLFNGIYFHTRYNYIIIRIRQLILQYTVTYCNKLSLDSLKSPQVIICVILPKTSIPVLRHISVYTQ